MATTLVPTEYAQSREWGISSDVLDFSRYQSLSRNWTSSQTLLKDLRSKLDDGRVPTQVATIGAAGSLGRMEASDLSDADLIIVLSDNVAVESQEANQIYGVVWDALGSIQRPNPRGVFAGPTSTAHLLARIGHGAENLGTIGKRLLLLLEAQPVYGDGQFEMVVHNLVDRYASEYVASDPRKEWTFLINDLIRYFRSICVHYQSTFDDQHEHDKWVLRNVKLRHSRLIMYVGLLALLGECSKVRDHKVEWLKQRLRWTPLERLAAVYEANTDWAFFRLAGLYDVFTGRVSDPCVRGGLQVGYADRYVCRAFAELKANSDALAAELSRFVLDRRGSWTDRFFEYLLF